jgi:putative transposase
MIAQVWHVARSSVYAAGAGTPSPSPSRKRGPTTEHSDEAVVMAIRAVLTATPFRGEDYRKVRARLAHRGLGFLIGRSLLNHGAQHIVVALEK